MNVVELTEHDGTWSWVAKNDHGRVIARGADEDIPTRAQALSDMQKFANDGYSVTETKRR
jgi:hypothetical protein